MCSKIDELSISGLAKFSGKRLSKKKTSPPNTIPALAEVNKELRKTAFDINSIVAKNSHRKINRNDEC